MTVGELIHHLSQFGPMVEVKIHYSSHDYYLPVSSVKAKYGVGSREAITTPGELFVELRSG